MYNCNKEQSSVVTPSQEVTVANPSAWGAVSLHPHLSMGQALARVEQWAPDHSHSLLLLGTHFRRQGLRVRSVWVEAPILFPLHRPLPPGEGSRLAPPRLPASPQAARRGPTPGSEGHSGQYLQAACLRGPPGFKLFLQLHLGFVHEQLQMLYLHLQGLQACEHRFVSAVESEVGEGGFERPR